MKGSTGPRLCRPRQPFAARKDRPMAARLTILTLSALLVAACNTTATDSREAGLSSWNKISVADLVINISDIPEISLRNAKQKVITRDEIKQIVTIGETDDGFVKIWQKTEGLIHLSHSESVKQQGNMDSWIRGEFDGEKFRYEESTPIEGLGRTSIDKPWIHKGRIGWVHRVSSKERTCIFGKMLFLRFDSHYQPYHQHRHDTEISIKDCSGLGTVANIKEFLETAHTVGQGYNRPRTEAS